MSVSWKGTWRLDEFIEKEKEKNLDELLEKEKEKNNALISELIMFKEIVEKKYIEFMNMSDKDKMNAKISKGFHK